MHHRTFACQSGAPERRKYLGDVAVSVAAVAVSITRIWPSRRSRHLGLARHGGQTQHSLTAMAAALPGAAQHADNGSGIRITSVCRPC